MIVCLLEKLSYLFTSPILVPETFDESSSFYVLSKVINVKFEI